MQVLRILEEVERHVGTLRRENRSIALVPTMGGLHPGHVALLQSAAQYADVVIASLFVNPLQFDCKQDFDSYQRVEEADFKWLREHHVGYVFAPDHSVMIPPENGDGIYVTPGTLGLELCGRHRPGHFQGMLTIVAKLLNIFSPDFAVFGEKDYQQLLLVRKMVTWLNFTCRIIAVPTVRERDGLACSSRNVHLDGPQRKQAPLLYAGLSQLAAVIRDQNPAIKQYSALASNAIRQLNKADFEVDYLEVRDADTLHLVSRQSKRLVILAAVRLGQTRLIDNITVTPKQVLK